MNTVAMPFQEFLPSLREFRFSPYTYWEDLFQGWFQTNINIFGKNTGDKAVEAHVLNNVGSYGMQINTILDAVMVLVAQFEKQQPTGAISQRDVAMLYRLKELAVQADKVASEFQGKMPEMERRG